MDLVISWSLAVVLLFFPESAAWAYRPFVSTDAAVADVKEMEIELGYFNWARERGKNTFVVPKIVLNFGLVQNLELVGEFGVEVPPRGPVQLADPALSLKSSSQRRSSPREKRRQLCRRGRTAFAVHEQRRK